MWITISFVFLAALSFAALGASFFAVRIARQAMAFQPEGMRSFASKLRSIEQCQIETDDAMAQLANRVKMQRVRNAANHIRDPEPIEPTQLKAHLRRKAGLVAGQPANHRESA